MTDRVVDTVYFLRKIIEGRDKTGKTRRILIHCQDGYTESSIIVLAYLMSSLSISLPEAFLHLQNQANRSFFLYPSDKPLLRKVDARLTADRKAKAEALVNSGSSRSGSNRPTSPSTPSGMSKWKSWGMGFGKGEALAVPSASASAQTPTVEVEVAKKMLVEEEKGGSDVAVRAKGWFDDRRFDGFPSRILPFLYLGNL
jgi:dual specificity MAP kinase phosphatase